MMRWTVSQHAQVNAQKLQNGNFSEKFITYWELDFE
jgi:hypothetical protein